MDTLIRTIINAKYERYVADIIRQLQGVRAEGWDSDDSALHTLWDHWKHEMQEEHSIFHDLIEDMVYAHVSGVVESIPHDEGALLTLLTDYYTDMDEPPTEPLMAPEAITQELMGRVNGRASDEPHGEE